MTYHIKMDNEESLDVRADNAGQAMYLALHRVRGSHVRSCFSGGFAPGDDGVMFEDPAQGRITFEVPAHRPLPLEPEYGRQRLCAKYVRSGYRLELEGISWEVLGIHKLPASVRILLERGLRQEEPQLLDDQLVTVDVPTPNSAP